MKRQSLASVLLLVGGIAIVVSLPLQWFARTYPNGVVEARSGTDFAGYDVITTGAIGLLLVAAAFGVAAASRWGRRLGATLALCACLWAALVIVSVVDPTEGVSAVRISIGAGAYAVAAGAALALLGGLMSFRVRGDAVVTSRVASSV